MAYVEISEMREIIETLGITAAEFARRTHVSRSYVSHLLSGRKSNPSKLWAMQVIRLCENTAALSVMDETIQTLSLIADRIKNRTATAVHS